MLVSVCARQSPSRFAAMPRPNGSVFPYLIRLRIAGRVLVSAPARDSARVTGRRQPPRQRSRRLVSKTSTRLALTPVYLPYINRISGVNGYFGVKTLQFTVVWNVFQGRRLRLGNAGKTPVCLSDDESLSGAARKGGKGCLTRYSE